MISNIDRSRNQLKMKEHVHYILAGNKNTPAKVLVQLSKSPFEKVRLQVAENPKTPEIALFRLLRDDSAEVRVSAACNGNIKCETLQEIIKYGDDDVKYLLAENDTIPTTYLLSLCFAENPYVKDRAERTLYQKLL